MAKTRNRLQKFSKSPDCRYVFRRRRLYGGEIYDVGDPIPEKLFNHKGKLQAMWDSCYIEHAPEGAEHVEPKSKSKAKKSSKQPSKSKKGSFRKKAAKLGGNWKKLLPGKDKDAEKEVIPETEDAVETKEEEVAETNPPVTPMVETTTEETSEETPDEDDDLFK